MRDFIKAIGKEFSIKKVILMVLMTACIVFICGQKQSFLTETTYRNGQKSDYKVSGEIKALARASGEAESAGQENGEKLQKLSMKGNAEIRETFTSKEGYLDTIGLVFSNPSGYAGTGTVSLTVFDSEGKKIADKASLNTALVSHGGITSFSMVGDTNALNSTDVVSSTATSKDKKGVKVTKGGKYTLVLESENVKVPEGLDVMLEPDMEGKSGALAYNGQKLKGASLYAPMTYSSFQKMTLAVFIILYLLVMVIILLPLDRMSEGLGMKSDGIGGSSSLTDGLDLNKLALWIMFWLTPFYVYYMLAKVAGVGTMTAIRFLLTFKGALNILIIGLVWWLVYTICNRTNFTIVITTFLGFAFGMANYLLILFRDSSLVPGLPVCRNSSGCRFILQGDVH